MREEGRSLRGQEAGGLHAEHGDMAVRCGGQCLTYSQCRFHLWAFLVLGRRFLIREFPTAQAPSWRCPARGGEPDGKLRTR